MYPASADHGLWNFIAFIMLAGAVPFILGFGSERRRSILKTLLPPLSLWLMGGVRQWPYHFN